MVRERGGSEAMSRFNNTQPQSLLSRVQLLESAMATLVEAQVCQSEQTVPGMHC